MKASIGNGLLAVALAFTACSPLTGGSGSSSMPRDAARQSKMPKIQHVVIVVQENRSFDNIFSGFPGADSASSGLSHEGTTVQFRATGFKGPDINHNWLSAQTDWDGGKMDGFDIPWGGNRQHAGGFPYAYLFRAKVAPYWAMARQYVLADRMFPTEFGPSFTAHIDLVAGTTAISPDLTLVDIPTAEPWSCDAPPGTITSTIDSHEVLADGPFPCFDKFRTLTDAFDDANISWRYYSAWEPRGAKSWSTLAAFKNIRYGSDYNDNLVTPETTFLRDVADGQLADVSWVTPDEQDSDHAGSQSDTGPSWVAAVVNAVGRSRYWNSTAIVILWDDWGGWYDHVPPPQLDNVGLGIRVPCIIVSPYAKKSYVSHTQYEFGSVLKFVETTFGLPPLGPARLGHTDDRAANLTDAFDFTQPPRRFKVIPAPYPESYFLTHSPALIPPDNE